MINAELRRRCREVRSRKGKGHNVRVKRDISKCKMKSVNIKKLSACPSSEGEFPIISAFRMQDSSPFLFSCRREAADEPGGGSASPEKPPLPVILCELCRLERPLGAGERLVETGRRQTIKSLSHGAHRGHREETVCSTPETGIGQTVV
jgi:hypothetical protein